MKFYSLNVGTHLNYPNVSSYFSEVELSALINAVTCLATSYFIFACHVNILTRSLKKYKYANLTDYNEDLLLVCYLKQCRYVIAI